MPSTVGVTSSATCDFDRREAAKRKRAPRFLDQFALDLKSQRARQPPGGPVPCTTADVCISAYQKACASDRQGGSPSCQVLSHLQEQMLQADKAIFQRFCSGAGWQKLRSILATVAASTLGLGRANASSMSGSTTFMLLEVS